MTCRKELRSTCSCSTDWNRTTWGCATSTWEPIFIPFKPPLPVGWKTAGRPATECRFYPELTLPHQPRYLRSAKVSQEAYNQFYKEDVEYYLQQEGLTTHELLRSTFVDEEFLHIRKSSTFKLGTGVSLTYRYKEDAALRLYCDYDFASPRLTYDLKIPGWMKKETAKHAPTANGHRCTTLLSEPPSRSCSESPEKALHILLILLFSHSNMIDQATIDRILDAAQIVDVVSEFVTLRRRGVNYIGLCPFHNEKTPSFSVSPSKGLCKCFSCGKGGNVVHFIMEHEQLSYYEALKWLAKYNIEIKERELTEEEKQAHSLRESLFVVNQFAAEYFQNILYNHIDGQRIGMTYLRSRGFRDDIIKKFQLGYSLDNRDALARTALQKAISKSSSSRPDFVTAKTMALYTIVLGTCHLPRTYLVGQSRGFWRTRVECGHQECTNEVCQFPGIGNLSQKQGTVWHLLCQAGNRTSRPLFPGRRIH